MKPISRGFDFSPVLEPPSAVANYLRRCAYAGRMLRLLRIFFRRLRPRRHLLRPRAFRNERCKCRQRASACRDLVSTIAPLFISGLGGSAPGLLFRERFKGTTQEILFDRPARHDATSVVLPMVIVTGSAQIRLQSPLPSRFARSSRSLRWRHRPLTLHASRGFSGVPANQSIDREFSGNCHSQKRYSRPPVRASMRRHAKKRNRARHDQARP